MGWRGAQHAELAQREGAQWQGSGEGCPHGASSRPSLPDLRLPLGWQAGAPRTLPMCARRPWGGAAVSPAHACHPLTGRVGVQVAGALTSRPCSVALASAKEGLLGQGTPWVSRAAAPDEAYQLVWVADGLDRGSWRMLRSPPTSGRLRPSVTDELPHPQGSQGQRGHFSVEA